MNALVSDDPRSHDTAVTRIVGLGASAGGLEALEQFLAYVPPDSGLAYVVVQHLDPTHKAMLTELLQRATAMPVHEATAPPRVRPGREISLMLGPNARVDIAGKTVEYSKLKKDDVLTVWVPERALAVISDPDDTASSTIVLN
jgi:two-component system, chemotaxis family, CheB/CheR fusion protein